MQCCSLAGKSELRVTHVSAMNKILTVKEKMGEKKKNVRNRKGPWKHSGKRTEGCQYYRQWEAGIPPHPLIQFLIREWTRRLTYREREIRRDVIGLSRQKQPKTFRIFPKGLQLSCVFSLQTLMYRALETLGSFQVSASIEKVKLGVVVKFHIVSVIRHPNQKDT